MSLVPNWVKTLSLSFLATGAQKLAEPAAAADPLLSIGAVASTVVAGYLVNRATSQHEVSLDQDERNRLTQRNHHLRRALAAALHRAINDSSLNAPGAPPTSVREFLLAELARCATDDAPLENYFPTAQADSDWSSTNPYRQDNAEDIAALASIFQQRIPALPSKLQGWTDQQATLYAQHLLPTYRQAFSDRIIANEHDFLFRAFAIKGLNEIRALMQSNHAELLSRFDRLENFQPSPTKQTKLWNFPTPTGFFTGRTQLLADMHAALNAHKHILLHGTPGFGKTQTALESAQREATHFQYVIWLRAADPGTLQSSYETLAPLLGLNPSNPDFQKLAPQALTGFLANHSPSLLILDNLDHPDTILPLLPKITESQPTLATSRRPHVSGIAKFYGIEIQTWTQQEAEDFLTKRTNLPPDPASITELAQLLDGYPLALEQAAAYVENISRSWSTYLAAHNKLGPVLLDEQLPEAGAYGATLARTIEIARAALSPAANELLTALAFLSPTNIPCELIRDSKAVLGPILLAALNMQPFPLEKLAAELERASLIHRDTSTDELSIHRLVQHALRSAQDSKTKQVWFNRWTVAFMCFLPDDANHLRSEPHERAWRSYFHFFTCAQNSEGNSLESWQLSQIAIQFVVHFTKRGLYLEAIPIAEQNLTWCECNLAFDHPDTLGFCNNLANLYKAQGRYAKAEPLYLRALTTRERTLGPDHPDTLGCRNNLANLYKAQGRFAEAEPLYQRAFTIYERILGPDHPDTLSSCNNLASLYQAQSRYAEAEPLHQRALTIRKRTLGPEHPDTLASCNSLACLYCDQGRYAEAEPLNLRAFTIYERILGPDHPDTLGSCNNLASLYCGQGRYAEAEALARRVHTALLKLFGESHPNSQIAKQNLDHIRNEIHNS